MTVVANCSDCDDVHPASDRVFVEEHVASTCPACGSTSYSSESTSEPIRKSEADRIRDAVSPVDGVGEQTCEALVERFIHYSALEAADHDDLVAVEGVGDMTAEGILDRVSPDREGGFVFGEEREGGRA